MADQRITQLNQLNKAGVDAADVLPIADISASETKKVTAKDLFEAGATVADNGTIDLAKLNQSSATKLGTAALADDAVTYDKLQNVSTTDRLLGRSSVGAGNVEEIPLTAAGRALLDDANAAAQRTTLGLGTIATQDASNVAITGGTITGGTVTGIIDLAVADGGTGASTASGARTNLGVAIGSNVQAYDAGLQSIAGLTTSANQTIYTTGSDTYATTTLSAFGRSLIDDANAAAARSTLGLGTLATQSSDSVAITGGTISGLTSIASSASSLGNVTITSGSITGITDLAVDDGGTGASTASAARINLGLVIGTDVQAFNSSLQSIARLTTGANQTIYTTGSNTYAVTSLSSFGRSLIDDADAATARSTLELGSLATQSGTFSGTSSGVNTGDQTITLTGDVTGSGTGSFAATIASDAVTTAKINNSAVTTDKINNAAVTGAKLAADSTLIVSGNTPAGNGAFQGQQWINTNTGITYVWTGATWQQVSALQTIHFVDTTPISFAVTKPDNFSAVVTTTLENQTAATVFAGPTSGAADAPTFRTLVSSDLPTATAGVNGVMQPGSGLSVTGAGVLNHTNSVAAGTYTKVAVDAEGHVTNGTVLSAADIPNLDASKITTGTFSTSLIGNESITAAKIADSSTVLFGGAGSTSGVVTFPAADFKGQYFYDEINQDLYIWSGSAWLPITIISGELIFAGTYNAALNQVGSVTTAGSAVGLSVGAALPAASDTNNRYYLVVSDSGTGTGNAPQEALAPPDMILSNGTSWELVDVSSGIGAQLATNVTFTPYGGVQATNVQAAIQELDDEKLSKTGGTITGNLEIGPTGSLTFEGPTPDSFETTLTVSDPTADRTITLPNVTGTLVTTGDTGTVTSTMIADGTVVDADISATAGITHSKLATMSAGQVLLGNAGNVPTATNVTGDISISSAGVTAISAGVIVDADINVAAAIGDGKLATISTANKVNISAIDIDGGTDIGSALADADLFLVDDGGSGTNRKAAASRITDYTFGKVTGDVAIASNGTASISSNVIVDADVNTSAAIAGTKISPNFGAQNVTTTGTSTAASFIPTSSTIPTNGVYLPAANSVGISSNGAQRVAVDASGNVAFDTNTLYVDAVNNRVSIGTTSPASTLDVRKNGNGVISSFTGSTNNSYITISDNNNTNSVSFGAINSGDCYIYSDPGKSTLIYSGGSERARIDSSGRLLLGTSTSRTNANVTPNLQVEGTSFDAASAQFTVNSNDTQSPYLSLAKSRGTTLASNTIVQSDDQLGSIRFLGADGTAPLVAASIVARVDGTPGANDMPGRLVFSTTADGASSPTERLRIDSSGNIGIRASASTIEAQLDITNVSGTGGLLVKRTTTVAGGPSIRFLTSSATGQLQHTGDLQIQCAAVGGTPSEIARFTTAGQFRLAGAGITFNGDTATANELDDYEEGTWTPTIEGTSTAGTGTYAVQIGRYTKIGNRVLFQCYVTWTAHTGTGNMDVAGLPFTTSAATNTWSTVSSWSNNVAFTAGNTLQPYTAVNTTKILLRQVPTGGGASAAVALDTAGELMLAGHYIV